MSKWKVEEHGARNQALAFVDVEEESMGAVEKI